MFFSATKGLPFASPFDGGFRGSYEGNARIGMVHDTTAFSLENPTSRMGAGAGYESSFSGGVKAARLGNGGWMDGLEGYGICFLTVVVFFSSLALGFGNRFEGHFFADCCFIFCC